MQSFHYWTRYQFTMIVKEAFGANICGTMMKTNIQGSREYIYTNLYWRQESSQTIIQEISQTIIHDPGSKCHVLNEIIIIYMKKTKNVA